LCAGMDANHTPPRSRYTVNEAAEILGISAEAVRARINRGTLQKEKDEHGTVYVRMDAARTHPDGRTDGDATGVHTPLPESKAFQLMQDQIDYLRDQLAEEREARRRADTIIAQLTQANATLAGRVPELEAPDRARESPETAFEGADGGESSEPVSQRSWWRRIFGG
jgi:hypothetical protein